MSPALYDVPEYQSLAALRGALTSDDPDVRGDAYSAVYEVEPDVRPSEVLAPDPADEVLQRLAEADVIPGGSDVDAVGAVQFRREALDLLQAIAENTGGS